MSKVKKVGVVTGERNIKGTVGKKRVKAAPEHSGRTGKSLASRAGSSNKLAEISKRRRAAGPMKKAAKGSRTTGTSAKKQAVASGVKGKRGKSDRTKKGRSVRGRRPVSDAPVVTVAVKELDPRRKCGPNTTVQFLYRVDESVNGRSTAHLVFFDRHGWYCEHGRTCPAVGHAKKHNGHAKKTNGQIARVS